MTPADPLPMWSVGTEERTMTRYTFQYADAVVVTRGDESFGAHDAKGRELGARWSISMIVASEADGGSSYSSLTKPGVHYMVRTKATRGDVVFGASHHPSFFDTVVEAQAAVDRYLKGAKARALKKFPPKA